MGPVVTPPAFDLRENRKNVCTHVYFTIGQSSGVYKSMRWHGSSRWCVFDAFMRSHLAKQLCGSFKVLSAHRFLRHLWESGPIVDASTNIAGRSRDRLLVPSTERRKLSCSIAYWQRGRTLQLCHC